MKQETFILLKFQIKGTSCDNHQGQHNSTDSKSPNMFLDLFS